MKKINFKSLEIYSDISKSKKISGDARESFANILYTQANGIKMHALAMKIYKSEGSVPYTDEEVSIIENVSNRYCTPSFIDGVQEQLNNQEQ